MKRIFMILTIFSVTLLASCGSVSKSLPFTYMPNAGEGFIYGKFEMIQEDSYNYIGLGIVDQDNQKHVIRLDPKEEKQYQIIAVPAGSYIIKEILYIYTMGDLAGSEAFKSIDGFNSSFSIMPGEAMYIGDFSGFTGGKFTATSKTFGFLLKEPMNRYIETTEYMKANYPFINELLTNTAFVHD